MAHGNRYARYLLLALVVASPAFAQTPRIRGFTPESGPPGTLVKIIGENFDAVAGVFFHGVESPSPRIISSEHLKALVPEGATTGPIGLLDRDGLRSFTLRPFVVVQPGGPRPPLSLAPPRPSPAAGDVVLAFSLAVRGPVRLEVFDLGGKRARVLVSEDLLAGLHERTWDGRDDRARQVPTGLYFVRLEAEGRQLVRRLILVQ